MTSSPPPQRKSKRWRSRLAALRLDVTPIRTSRDFRLLLAGGTVFYLLGMVGYVAVPYQLYHLTGSNFAVGAYGLAQLLPLILCGLYGGALADRLDRRKVIVYTGLAQAACVGLMMANALQAKPSVAAIYVIGVLMTVAQALQRPSKEALTQQTVKHDELPAAITLSSFGIQGGMLIGPAVGGLVLASKGPAWAFGITLVGMAAASAIFAFLRPYKQAHATVQAGLKNTVKGIADGLTCAVRRKDLLGTYVVDLTAMFLAMPTVLFPAFASDVLHRPELLGLLYTAGTVGSLLATATSGWTARVHHHGRAVVFAAAGWGAAMLVAGVSPNVWLVLAALVVAGAADMISGVFRSIIWNQTIPDERRGRLAGIEMLSYSIGPLGGEARAGLVADATSVRASIASGGLLCVIGVAAVAVWLRDFWRYDASTDEHAVREREFREARAAEERAAEENASA